MTCFDFREVVRRFREDLGERVVSRPAAFWGLSPNFVTPEVLGFVESSSGRVAEISTGVMPVWGERPRREVRVYGVTFRPDDSGSTFCESWAEVLKVLDHE